MIKYFTCIAALACFHSVAQITTDSLIGKELEGITIISNETSYKIDSSTTVSKLPLSDLENSQVYNSISKQVIKDQVVTNLYQGMQNATGVARLWESTGRGGDGAEYYSMRGFSVQPTLMNGMPYLTSGTTDPINIEKIEVIKGPSGALYGGNIISYGGLINVETKKPFEKTGGSFGLVVGSYGLNRYTADVNLPVSKQAFVRINAAYQYQNSFQDQGYGKTLFLAPSFKFLASNKLTILVNTEFSKAESPSIPMIFLNRNAPLQYPSIKEFEQNYFRSFGSNSLTMKNPGFALQAQALYKISPTWSSQTVVASGNSKTDGYYQYLYDLADGQNFGRFISKRNGETTSLGLQQNFTNDTKFGSFRNRLLLGVDYLYKRIENNSTSWELYGGANIPKGIDTTNLSVHAVDNALKNWSSDIAETEIYSGYITDVFNFNPKLSVMASLRVDNFKGKPQYAVDNIKSQTTLSPKLGIVYQPIINKVALFANYLNGFKNLTPQQVADIDGSNPRLKIFDPEQANQWEAGIKTNILKNKVSLTASYYDIKVSNKTMTDPNNINNTIQGGQVKSNGYEFSLLANPITGLQLIAGYSQNVAKVTKDFVSSGYLGLRPEEAGPERLVNVWANYKLPYQGLKGFNIGIGGNYASEYLTLNRSNIGTFTLPSYTVLNAVLGYTIGDLNLQLKANNITNTKYYIGWSTITPQRPRAYALALNYNF